MGQIRPAVPADIPELTVIRRRSFQHSSHATDEALAHYFDDVFFRSPWSDAAHPSWVFDDGGQVRGFLGSITRPLRFGDERLSMGVLSHFMVHPDSRGKGIGKMLMEHFLDGPQDIFWSDVANDATRSAWKACGGHDAHLQTLSWRRPLRPVRHGSAQAIPDGLGRVALRLVRPLISTMDRAIVRRPHSRYGLPAIPGQVVPFDPSAVAGIASELIPAGTIQPVYTTDSFAWLMQQLRRKSTHGTLDASMVMDGGSVVGWFIWFVNPGGMSTVVQLVSRPESAATTFGHLVRIAWERGVVTLEGRMEPLLIDALAAGGASFRLEPPSVMVHSRHQHLLVAIHGGQSVLTRLDGEWWMSA